MADQSEPATSGSAPVGAAQASAEPASGASTTGQAGTTQGMTFRPDRRFWVVYGCLMLVMFLSAMYQTVVATALPTIVGDLGGVSRMSWAITAYTLAQTVAMPVYGRLGDTIGRKPLYLVAIALFVGGSALCGTSTSMEMFVAFRFLQGLGGGGLIISSQAITGDLIPPRVRATYTAPLGAMFGLASILGPLLGGWLTDVLSWRWVFWFFLPFGTAAWVLVALNLQLPRRHVRVRIDWLGLALANTGAVGTVLIATWGGALYPWSSPVILGLGLLTLLAWGALLPVERRAAEPIMPPSILTNRTFAVATVVSVLALGCLFGINGYLPTYLQMVYGVSASASGLLLVPGAAGMVMGSMLSGALVTRTGRYRLYPVVGSLLGAAGMAVIGLANQATPLWWMCAGVFVLSLGIGLFFQLIVLVIQNALPASVLGTATSANNFFREIGVSLGNTIVGVVFTSRLTSALTAAGLSSQDSSSLTPQAVRELGPAVHASVVSAYVDSLSPVVLALVPVLLLSALVALGFEAIPLSARTGLEQRELEKALTADPTPLAGDVPLTGDEAQPEAGQRTPEA
ncbi:MDR family MFS transporter [Actinomyces sp. 2119]|uniref:MDR family MFS transporter n=1 Tax=Actinomyces sp. 2119 TaxID=2321393 RepID=UPI00217593AA|nr:MDR family MFS transporter [Actinomyces sp. 2119]